MTQDKIIRRRQLYLELMESWGDYPVLTLDDILYSLQSTAELIRIFLENSKPVKKNNKLD